MNLNILPYDWVDTLMLQQIQSSLLLSIYPHEYTMYPRNKVFKKKESHLQFFFKPGKSKISQAQQQ